MRAIGRKAGRRDTLSAAFFLPPETDQCAPLCAGDPRFGIRPAKYNWAVGLISLQACRSDCFLPVRRLRIMTSQAQTLRTIARADQITHLIDTGEAPAVVADRQILATCMAKEAYSLLLAGNVIVVLSEEHEPYTFTETPPPHDARRTTAAKPAARRKSRSFAHVCPRVGGLENRGDYTPAGVVRARAIQMATRWAG